MKKNNKNLFKFIGLIIGLYTLFCAALYFFQALPIFNAKRLSPKFEYDFKTNFQEINIKSVDGLNLHGVLFKAKNSKGLIFFMHGNGGTIARLEKTAKFYTDLNYDVFMPEYRGFGKSEGKIQNENEMFEDHQLFYEEMKGNYPEEKIIVMGYSIGTGFATKLASQNSPRLLILQAPYFSIPYVTRERYPFIPQFLVKFKLNTNQNIQKCKMQVIIFHGENDNVIPVSSSLKLRELLKPEDNVIILKNQGHFFLEENTEFQEKIKKVLE